jgi:hypothetical protein
MRTIVHGVRTLVLICVIISSSYNSFSQSISTGNGKIEIGLGLGPMFFVGDLGGNYGVGKTFVKDVNLPLTKFSKGLYVNIYPAEYLGFRIAFNQSIIDGYDSIIKLKGGEEVFRKARNQDFKSNVLEGYAALEFYPTVFFERYEGLQGKFRPYGLIGIGVFHFNPQGLYYPSGTSGPANWVDLQPLRLEGQGMAEYPDRPQFKLTQIEIPMGFGFKYYLKENMYIGLEILHRKTFTDYIDAVSKDYIDPSLFDKYLSPQQAVIAKQIYYRGNLTTTPVSRNPLTLPPPGEQRGDPKQNDAFFSSMLRFGWRLNQMTSELRRMRCPSFY